MVSWISILVAAAFACFAVKIGFYEICVMLFNIVIAIYLAVFLHPAIVEITPAAGSTARNCALTIMLTAIACFLILHGISYIFLTGQFKVSFSKVFDTLGAASLGFLAGCLIYSFISLLICITPMSQNTFIKKIGFGRQPNHANLSHTYWWCNNVNKIVSRAHSECPIEQFVSELLKSAEPKSRTKPGKTPQSPEPNDTEPAVIKEDKST